MASRFIEDYVTTAYDFDPDATTVTEVVWLDMSEHDEITATFTRTVGTGDVDLFRLVGNSASDGSGTDVTITTWAGAAQPDAVGDFIVINANADDIAAAAGATDVRYVGIFAQFATGTDEGVIHAIRRASLGQASNTADIVA